MKEVYIPSNDVLKIIEDVWEPAEDFTKAERRGYEAALLTVRDFIAKEAFSYCDACGKPRRNNYGIELSLATKQYREFHRIKLCERCANKLVPIMAKAFVDVLECRNQMENYEEASST